MDEVLSEVWSQSSDTDRLVFTVLSNGDRVDLSSLPTGPTVRDTPHIVELPSIDEEATSRPQDGIPEPYSIPTTDPAFDADPTSTYRPYVPSIEPVQEAFPSSLPLSPVAERHHDPPQEGLPTRPSEPCPEPEASRPLESRPLESRPPEPPPLESRPLESRPPEPPPLDEKGSEYERRSVLLDLQRLEMQGIKLTKQFTIDDNLDDMTLELRRHVLAMDERSNVNMMRDGLRMLVTGVEMMSNRFGVLDLEGWSTEVCRDLSRHDPNLARIYRKYWRRSSNNTPEAEIAFAILGSAGMHHMKRSMSRQFISGGRSRSAAAYAQPSRRPPTPDTSDEEAPP